MDRLTPRPTPQALSLVCVDGHVEGAVGGQRLVEHLGGARVVPDAAALQQHSGLQAAQVSQLEPVGHLLSDFARDPELAFGFIPPTSRCGGETRTSLHKPGVQGEPPIPELEHAFHQRGQRRRFLMEAT